MEESNRPRSGWWTAFLMLAIVGVLILLILPVVNDAGPRPRSACKNNLKQIGLALLNYESTYGSLPPVYIANKDGEPIHSWRALLLPFLELDEVYAQYDFHQAWNSPHNSKLANSLPKSIRCGMTSTLPDGFTNYVAVTGPGRVFDGARATRLKEITDGPSNTIMAIEVPDSQGVPWFSPFATLVTTAQSNHKGGGNAVFADGSVQFLESDMKPETMSALQTIAGGERFDDQSENQTSSSDRQVFFPAPDQ